MFKNYCNEELNLFNVKDKILSNRKLNYTKDISIINNKMNILDDINIEYFIKLKLFNDTNYCYAGLNHNNILCGLEYNIYNTYPSYLMGYKKKNFDIICKINNIDNVIDSNVDLSTLYKYKNIYTALNLNAKYNKYNNVEGLIGYKNKLFDNNIRLSFNHLKDNIDLIFNTEGNITDSLSIGTGIKIDPTNINEIESNCNIIGSIKYKYEGGNINLIRDFKEKSIISKIEHKITDNFIPGLFIKYNNNSDINYGFSINFC